MENENYKKVALCNSFEQLEEVLKELGNVEGSHREYAPEDNIYRMKRLRELKKQGLGVDIRFLTRAYGIRAKVAELLCYEH